MSDAKDIGKTFIDGATKGLSGEPLFDFVRKEFPKAKLKKIVNGAFYALSEPDLKDRNILNAIYAVGLRHRAGEDQPEVETPTDGDAPKIRSRKAKSKKEAPLS